MPSDLPLHEINSSQIWLVKRKFVWSKSITNVKKPLPSEVTTKTRLWLGVCTDCTWYHPGHIIVLEVRCALLGLRWRTRSAKRIFTRIFCLLDSQVALAVSVKGRSSSLMQIAADKKEEGSGVDPCRVSDTIFGDVRSDWNPLDNIRGFLFQGGGALLCRRARLQSSRPVGTACLPKRLTAP